MSAAVLTVKQLNMYLKSVIDGDVNLCGIYVSGEISNFKRYYQSGHIYFTLKDKDSCIKAIMFKSAALNLKFEPNDGMNVICFGKVSVFERDGQYQLYVTSIEPQGTGALALAYEQLKDKLEKEGLFSQENKRPIPKFPKGLGVVTSKSGAALQDILSIMNRRAPNVPITVCPAKVQGDGSCEQLISSLLYLYSLDGIDVIIIGRGGGSIEDLWSFNDEKLARTIYESPVPVISAVGHETDFTICDFVSDMRAPTPSAAAEIVSNGIFNIFEELSSLKNYLQSKIENKIFDCNQMLVSASSCRFFSDPDLLFSEYSQKIEKIKQDLQNSMNNSICECDNKLKLLASKLDALSPLSVISRGYSITKHNGNVLKSVSDVNIDDNLEIILKDGKIQCRTVAVNLED